VIARTPITGPRRLEVTILSLTPTGFARASGHECVPRGRRTGSNGALSSNKTGAGRSLCERPPGAE
jgi:hypothetical protein